MDDDKRFDLSGDLDGLLADVEAATKHAKKREADDRAKDARNAEKKKKNTTSVVIIGVAAVVLILISYFVVFGSGDNAAGPAVNNAQKTVNSVNAPIKNPTVNKAAPKTPPMAPPSQTRRPLTQPHPPEGYEQGGEQPM